MHFKINVSLIIGINELEYDFQLTDTPVLAIFLIVSAYQETKHFQGLIGRVFVTSKCLLIKTPYCSKEISYSGPNSKRSDNNNILSLKMNRKNIFSVT